MSLRDAQVRATVAVADMERAAEFYEGALGLEPLAGDEGMAAVRIYPCGEGSLLQVYESEHAGSGSATAASWSAPDFDEVVAGLRDAGVSFESSDEPGTDEDGVHSFGAHRVCWFKDPDGNTIALDNGAAPS